MVISNISAVVIITISALFVGLTSSQIDRHHATSQPLMDLNATQSLSNDTVEQKLEQPVHHQTLHAEQHLQQPPQLQQQQQQQNAQENYLLQQQLNEQQQQHQPEESLQPEPEVLLPSCLKNSVCNLLQVNAYGISQFPYCNCTEDFSPCGTTWDPSDGRSITQSVSDQYKFCGSAPKLKPCENINKPAYTSYQYYHKVTGSVVLLKDKMHCRCPEDRNYLDSRYKFYEQGLLQVEVALHYCLPLKQCSLGEYCKSVTDVPNKYLINENCRCAEGLACPTITNHGVDTKIFPEGLLHNIKCRGVSEPAIKSRLQQIQEFFQEQEKEEQLRQESETALSWLYDRRRRSRSLR